VTPGHRHEHVQYQLQHDGVDDAVEQAVVIEKMVTAGAIEQSPDEVDCTY
jgi:hypothetical protein